MVLAGRPAAVRSYILRTGRPYPYPPARGKPLVQGWVSPQAMTPDSRQFVISCSVQPASRNISSLCCPKSGGAWRYCTGVAESFIGLATRRSSGARGWDIGTMAPRNWACGSAKASAMELMEPQGTFAASSDASQSARGRWRITSSSRGTSTARWRTRSALVAKRGSMAHAGRPAISQNLVNCRSLPTARIRWPSLASKVW
mmetsp:Transcript_19963/g.32642  ORF Transcript_19963/g.32642 Transcript_19963/m.32642 type:complete len:201 (+) Transcript_19963:813-1415(+)